MAYLASPTPPSRVLLCLIDDTPEWHQVTAATVAHFPGFSLEGFSSAETALAALRRRPAAAWPRCVLMDYYLGDDRGDTLTEKLLGLAIARPFVVGYSTMTSGSEAIIRAAGGGEIVRKHANAEGINPSLWAWLQDIS